MKQTFFRNWSIYLLNGMIAVFYGVFALLIPANTLVAVTWYAGLLFLWTGIIILALSIYRIVAKKTYAVMLFQAAALITLGVVIMVFAQETITFLVIMMGVLAIIISMFMLALLLSLKQAFVGKKLFIITGIIALMFGVLMLFNPFQMAAIFVVISGVMALTYGIILLWFSTILYRLNKQSQINP